MVQHFHEHHADIGTWLEEISNEVTSIGSSYDNPEQIKKQQDSLKVCGLLQLANLTVLRS